MGPKHDDHFDGWEIAVAKNVVDQFIAGSDWFTEQDFDDLYQECRLRWWQVRSSYRVGMGTKPESYMGKVLRRKLTDIQRERTAKKRKPFYQALSLSDPLTKDDDSNTVEDVLSDDSSGPARSFHELTNLKLDLDKAFEHLNPRQKRVCQLIREEEKRDAVSQLLGLKRATTYDELIRIRKIFQDLGLKNYLN